MLKIELVRQTIADKLVKKHSMETVDAFEAKTRLAALLDRAAKGEKITITRHGIPAAVLCPLVDYRDGSNTVPQGNCGGDAGTAQTGEAGQDECPRNGRRF